MSYALSPGLSKLASLGAVLDRQNGPLAAIMEMVALAASSDASTLSIGFGPKDVNATFDGQLAQPGAGQDRRGWMPVQVYHLTDRPLLAGNGWGAMLEPGAEVFPIRLMPPLAHVRLSLPYRIQASPLSTALGIAPLNGDVLQRLIATLASELHRGLFFVSSLRTVQLTLNNEVVVRVDREATEWDPLNDGCRRRSVCLRTESKGHIVNRTYREYVGPTDDFRILIPAADAPAHEAWEDSGIFGRGAGRWSAPVPVACYGPFELARAGYATAPGAIAHDLATLGTLLARAVAHERERVLERWLPLWAPEPGPDPSHQLGPLLEGFWTAMPSLETMPDAAGGWWRADEATLTRAVACAPGAGDVHPAFEDHFPRFARRFPARLPVAPVEVAVEEAVEAEPEPPSLMAPSPTPEAELVAPAEAPVENFYGLSGSLVIGETSSPSAPAIAPVEMTATVAPTWLNPVAPAEPDVAAVVRPAHAPEEHCLIELLRLPLQVQSALQRARVLTVGQLRRLNADDLRNLRGMPEHSISTTLVAACEFQLLDEDPLAAIAIQALNLSPRSTNALVRANLLTVKALQGLDEGALLRLRGLGAAGVDEIRQALATFDPGAHAALHVAPRQEATVRSVEQELNALLAPLRGREADVLVARLGLETGERKTLEEVGLQLGVTRERIRQIEAKALRRLGSQSAAKLPVTRRLALESLRALGGLATADGWAKAVAEALPAGRVNLATLLAWQAETLPGVEIQTLRDTQVFVGPPLDASVLDEARACLDEFWAEHRHGTWEQLLQALAPAFAEPAWLESPAILTLIQALCLEPQPGIFSRDRWTKVDHVRFVLHEAGTPLHYEEIARRLQARLPNWSVEDPDAAVQALLLREGSGMIRTGQGTYGLEAWGGMRFSHFREVLLEYLCRQELPQRVEAIVEALSGTYAIRPSSFKWTLDDHPELFQRFGRAAIYGVAGRRYELPDETLLQALVSALEDGPLALVDLAALPSLAAYDSNTLELYLNVSPLFWITGSVRQARYALSIEGKRHYEPGDGPGVVAELFERLAEPLHMRDVWRCVRASYAYPPGEEPFRRVLVSEDYVPVVEHFFVPRDWLADPTLGGRFEDLDRELYHRIALVSLGQAALPDDATLFDWLSFCYLHHFFYRGALIFEKLNSANLPESQRAMALKIGRICQRNGDLSLLDPNQEGNLDQQDLDIRLDLDTLRKNAQGVRRQASQGLASLEDGVYRVRYGEADIEVHIEKSGGQDAPVAYVRGVLVGGEPIDPVRHAPLPGNSAMPEERAKVLTRLLATELTAYSQITPFLCVLVGHRRNWGLSYKSFQPLSQLTSFL